MTAKQTPVSETYDPNTCGHAPGEDCMSCIGCGKCSESLDDHDICDDCREKAPTDAG